MKSLRTPLVLLALAALLGPSPAAAALTADQLAVVYARGNRESEGLARYYSRKRGLPEERLIAVDLPTGEVLDRETWRWSVRPEIREWLAENDPDREIRCLVTTWGVPLKITAAKPDPAKTASYVGYLEAEKEARSDLLRQVVSRLDSLAGGSQLGQAFDALPDATADATSFKALQERLETALRSAQQRLASLTGDARRAEEAKLQQLATVTGGSTVLLQGVAKQVQSLQAAGQEVPSPMREQFNLLRGRAGAFNEIRQLLENRPPGFERDALALQMLEQVSGQLGCLKWLDEQIKVAGSNQTTASFDSELSLVLWDDGYELLRWQPNYLRGSFANSRLGAAFPTLMVSRIDGPDLVTAKRLIDDAIAVEEAGGLVGKAYLDARGLAELQGPPLEPGSYPDYDRSLLATAKGLEQMKTVEGEPRFEVVLNEQPELFAPGACPDAALYCGWYSLAKYVDAFDFNRGAVAFHLASAEAVTLKELDSQAWCKKLLEDGVAATIGPVNEPFLLAFPRPSEFFALLVRGDLTLAEVYYRTKPFNSWQMVLIGDPLYRPYAK